MDDSLSEWLYVLYEIKEDGSKQAMFSCTSEHYVDVQLNVIKKAYESIDLPVPTLTVEKQRGRRFRYHGTY